MGSNNNWNPIYQHRLKNYIFESDRILLFLLGCNPIKQLPIFQSSPRISSRNSYFSRGSRDRYNKSLFSVRSRGTKHPNSIGRRSWNLVGHKWSSNISPRNWFVKFKAITPVVNFSTNFFIPLLNFVEFSSTVKFCCGTWKLRQVGKLRTTKVTNVLIKIVLNAIYDYFYTRTKLFDFYR